MYYPLEVRGKIRRLGMYYCKSESRYRVVGNSHKVKIYSDVFIATFFKVGVFYFSYLEKNVKKKFCAPELLTING